MTDIIELPPNLFYDPVFFDNTILVLPLWVWIILGLCFIGFVAIICMIYIYMIMRPCSGYGKVGGKLGDNSMAKGAPTQVFSIWKNRNFAIEALWYYGNILSYGNPLKHMQMWLHSSEKATGVAAGMPVMITRDNFSGTVDLIAEMAMVEIPRIYNRDYGFEKILRRDSSGVIETDMDGNPIYDFVEKVGSDGKPVRLTSFSDIWNHLGELEKLYPSGVPVRIYSLHDLSEINQYTPQNEDSLKFGFKIVDDAKHDMTTPGEKKPAGIMGFITKNGLLIMCLLFGLISTCLVWVIFPVA